LRFGQDAIPEQLLVIFAYADLSKAVIQRTIAVIRKLSYPNLELGYVGERAGEGHVYGQDQAEKFASDEFCGENTKI